MTDIRELVKGIHDCPCGRDHSCPTETVEIGSGVLKKLPTLCDGYKKILLVADQNTYRVCGREAAMLLTGKLEGEVVFRSGGQLLIPDEAALEKLDGAVSRETDLIVGVGSGVINDLCKQIANQRGIPYFIVATAPSMDGYASSGAALILKGMKVTLQAKPPKAILADTRVLATAPLNMIRAGIGDILGKYSCLNDWKLSALLRDEYYCQRVYDLVYEAVVAVEDSVDEILKGEEKALGRLMEALVAVGIEISFVGSSRPASGSEHHLSHYFEITGILDGKPYLPHGIDVICSAVVTAGIREQLLNQEPRHKEWDRAAWETDIRRIYSASATEVIKLQDRLGWYEENDFQNVCGKWKDVCAILAEAPGKAYMLDLVKRIGLDYEAFESLYGAEKLEDAIRYAKDLKDRYSVLWLKDLYFE